MSRAGIIDDANEPPWPSMNAEDAARVMHNAKLSDDRCTARPELRAVQRLCGLIARGDSTAARQLVAAHSAMRKAHKRRRYEDILRAQRRLAEKTLADLEFARAVKDSILAFSVAAGIVSGPSDPKWLSMSVEQIAKLLSETDLTTARTKTPLMSQLSAPQHQAAPPPMGPPLSRISRLREAARRMRLSAQFALQAQKKTTKFGKTDEPRQFPMDVDLANYGETCDEDVSESTAHSLEKYFAGNAIFSTVFDSNTHQSVPRPPSPMMTDYSPSESEDGELPSSTDALGNLMWVD